MERDMTRGRNTGVRGQGSGVRGEPVPSSQLSALGSCRHSGLGSRVSGLGSRHPKPGFTLIEILIVVSIIGILITLAQPSFTRAVTAAKEATLKENLFILRDVIDQYYADNTKYPATLAELAEKGYIRRVPKDPITNSTDTWVFVEAMDEQGQPAGIFDIRSGSDRTSSDGSKYSDW